MATELRPKSTDEPEVRYRKQRPDLYTALLVIALVAIILGCVMLYLELQFFEFKYQGAPSVSTLWPAMGPRAFLPLSQVSTDALTTAQLLPV